VALTDLKMSKEERDEQSPQPMETSKGPQYPYGLSINLDDGTLEKLGVDELPKVGEYITIVALACVKSTSERSDDGGESERSVSLQIEKMRLGGDDDGDDDDVLKGKGKSAKMPVAKTLASKYEGT